MSNTPATSPTHHVLGYGISNVSMEPLNLSRLIYWINSYTSMSFPYPKFDSDMYEEENADAEVNVDEQAMANILDDILNNEGLQIETGLTFQPLPQDHTTPYSSIMIYHNLAWANNPTISIPPTYLKPTIPDESLQRVESLASILMVTRGFFVTVWDETQKED